MSKTRVRAALVVVLMALSFAGAAAWRPTVHLADQRPKVNLETMFPKAFGDWVVDDRMPVQLVSPDTAALLSKIYNQTLSRTYVNAKGERIMLSVAYGGDQSDATRAHRPEVCYPAQGFQVIASSNGVVTLGEHPLRVRRLVTQLGSRVEPITYWITVGDRVVISGTEQKLAQLTYGFRGTVADGMLVRVSSIDPDKDRALRLQEAFVLALSKSLTPGARSQILGSAAAS